MQVCDNNRTRGFTFKFYLPFSTILPIFRRYIDVLSIPKKKYWILMNLRSHIHFCSGSGFWWIHRMHQIWFDITLGHREGPPKPTFSICVHKFRCPLNKTNGVGVGSYISSSIDLGYNYFFCILGILPSISSE